MTRATHFCVLLVGLVASGCGETLSPVPDVDEARLWELLRSAPMGDSRVCDAALLDHADRQDLSTRCQFWAEQFADYLVANGVTGLSATDLTSTGFLQWVRATKARMAACREAVGTLAIDATAAERARHTAAKAACENEIRSDRTSTTAPTGSETVRV